MIIHSVTPIEYLVEQSATPQMRSRDFSGGTLEGYDGENGFVISRVISTDPSAYLRSEYAPGKIYRENSSPR